MPKLTIATMAALVTGAMLLAGCGSSGQSTTSGSRPVTQYTARANAICRDATSQTTPLIRRLTPAAEKAFTSPGGSGQGQLSSGLQRLHTIANDTLEKLRALKPPAADRQQVERFLTPFATVTRALGQATQSAKAGQLTAALAALVKAEPASRKMASTAVAAKLDACKQALAALP